MSIDIIFPAVELSATEQDLLAEMFSSAVMKKYLKILATEDAKELLALSAISKDKDTIAQAHATVQGKLQVVATLLSIGESQPVSPN